MCDSGDLYRPVHRWRPAFQNDFAARMDWSIKSFRAANHHPHVVVNGKHGKGIVHVNANPGSSIRLSAAGTTDPDGDRLSYKWWVYEGVGTYGGRAGISGASSQSASVSVPGAARGKTIHVILEVSDSGAPKLTSYRRVVITGK